MQKRFYLVVILGAIELYYHEEEGDIKDYIMYHIPERYCNTKSKVVKLELAVSIFINPVLM